MSTILSLIKALLGNDDLERRIHELDSRARNPVSGLNYSLGPR